MESFGANRNNGIVIEMTSCIHRAVIALTVALSVVMVVSAPALAITGHGGPYVTGDAMVGATLNVSSGTWTVRAGAEYVLTLQRCDDAAGNSCTPAESWRGTYTGTVTGEYEVFASDTGKYFRSIFYIDDGYDIDGGTSAMIGPIADFKELSLRVVGSGLVTSSPPGISCDITAAGCIAFAEAGTQVTLTALPDSGWVFAGWTGACSGASTTCTIVLSQNSAVIAVFAAVRPSAGASSGATSNQPTTTTTSKPTAPALSTPAAKRLALTVARREYAAKSPRISSCKRVSAIRVRCNVDWTSKEQRWRLPVIVWTKADGETYYRALGA